MTAKLNIDQVTPLQLAAARCREATRANLFPFNSCQIIIIFFSNLTCLPARRCIFIEFLIPLTSRESECGTLHLQQRRYGMKIFFFFLFFKKAFCILYMITQIMIMTFQRCYRNDYFVFYFWHTVNSGTGIKSLTAGTIKNLNHFFFFLFPLDASGCIVDLKRHE